MSLKTILEAQSKWTWDTMESSAHLGEMVREDALTSVNLAMIYRQAVEQGIDDFYITSTQGAKLEVEYGADWLWGRGEQAYLVQAKRLNIIARAHLTSYKIDLPQLFDLLDAAEALSGSNGYRVHAAYVFYNAMLGDNFPRADYGCTCVDAATLAGFIKEKSHQDTCLVSFADAMQKLDARPWHQMF
ncbi:hypothetical protein PTE30175_03645 [Pandoraea terrae]|uniref:Uncharacterized protein n=2 Tax=Pandoraea terrae TaxID=1537710 RepID=A0A5E4X909_9BURK|nr:hypothetical protein PTE30175_03645 [Pandoraea terrae]